MLATLFVTLGIAVAQESGARDAEGAYAYRIDVVATFFGGDLDLARLRTPQGALETFYAAGDAERYEEAAQVLNLADLPADERDATAAELAEKLHFVLARELEVDWRALPDRPNGAIDVPASSGLDRDGVEPRGAPAPRRNLLVGTVAGNGPPVEVRLERVTAQDLPPVWLIARSTVAHVDALYERYGPSWLERAAPGWLLDTLGDALLWRWLAVGLLMAASAGVGILLQRLAARLMRTSDRTWLRGLASEVDAPLATLASIATFWLAYTVLPGPPRQWAAAILTVLVVAGLTWLGTSVVDFFSEYIGKRHVDLVAHHDNRRARRRLTYLSVARRAFVVVVIVIGAGVALAQFGTLRTLGTSLLASAGVAGILVGIAAQGPLSNLIAGVQIALTQLVQIGDTVFYKDDYAYVEDVTYTFVVLRTWDQRRIAVPNRHVISHPLENWEMTSSHLVMPLVLYVDFRTPIDELRQRYVDLLEATEDWDREQPAILQVVELKDDVIGLQAWCSAADPDVAWRLACHLREELMAFLREWEDGRYLPRRRMMVEGLDRTPEHADES
jgi:small-conductance mechanosensitive channel